MIALVTRAGSGARTLAKALMNLKQQIELDGLKETKKISQNYLYGYLSTLRVCFCLEILLG